MRQKLFFKNLILVNSLILISFSPALGQGRSMEKMVRTDTTKIMAAASDFLKAFNNLEWENFHSSFSPSATVFQPFGNPLRHNNREELAEFFKSFFNQIKSTTEGPPYLTIIPQDLRIQMLKEAAVVTFHLPGDKVGRRTLVFARNKPYKPWQIAHLHASSLEDPGKITTKGPVSQEFEMKRADNYTGRYRLIGKDMPLEVTVTKGEKGLKSEIGDYKRELRYVGGHTFKEGETGYLFVFNVMSKNRATGITGISPEGDWVEVFELMEE